MFQTSLYRSFAAKILLAFAGYLGASAQGAVIFDNLGTNNSFTPIAGAQVIDDGGSSIRQIGASFITPPSAYPWLVTSVDLPLSLQLGTSNSFDVQIRPNRPGLGVQPDLPSLLWVSTGLAAPATGSPSVMTANQSGALLLPNQKYWVVVDGNANRGVWHYNTLGQTGQAVNLSTFGWSFGDSPNWPKPAFRINAMLSPPECYLRNHDFERNEITSGGPPNSALDWAGDLSHITGATLGITPHSGQRMLQFDGTTATGGSANTIGSEVWQLVDVTHLAADIAAGKVFADFNYYANRVEDVPDALPTIDTLFSSRIQAHTGAPTNFPANLTSPLATSNSQLISDNDADTWQRTSTTLQLPAGTTYLAVRMAAVENVVNDSVNEFAGHFADSACVHLRVIPEPATTILVMVALGVMLGRPRTSRQEVDNCR